MIETAFPLSIITIVLNDNKHIEQTIKSVLNQKCESLEYIVVDGASTDGTLEIISKYKPLINLISEPDNGIYHAINKGISMAKGSFIGLINSGDYYDDDTEMFSSVVKKFNITGADVIYGNIRIIEEEYGTCSSRVLKADHNYLKKRMSIFHPATFVSRRCYMRYGLYDLRYKSASDYDYYVKLFLNNVRFDHIDRVFANFRTGGISGTNYTVAIRENYEIRKKRIGLFSALRYMICEYASHYYLSNRKYFVQSIIGKRNYAKLKNIYYSTK